MLLGHLFHPDIPWVFIYSRPCFMVKRGVHCVGLASVHGCIYGSGGHVHNWRLNLSKGLSFSLA